MYQFLRSHHLPMSVYCNLNFWWRHQNYIYEKNADVSKILNFLWVKSFKHINTCFRTNFHIEMMFIKCFMDVLNISHYLTILIICHILYSDVTLKIVTSSNLFFLSQVYFIPLYKCAKGNYSSTYLHEINGDDPKTPPSPGFWTAKKARFF